MTDMTDLMKFGLLDGESVKIYKIKSISVKCYDSYYDGFIRIVIILINPEKPNKYPVALYVTSPSYNTCQIGYVRPAPGFDFYISQDAEREFRRVMFDVIDNESFLRSAFVLSTPKDLE